MNVFVLPPEGRRTKNPMQLGEVRAFGTRFLRAINGIVHGDEIIKELFALTNSIFGTDIEVVYIGEVNFLRRLLEGEWTGLAFKVEHLEEHRLGNILTISFAAKKISNGKDAFYGNFRIRLR